MRSSTVDRPKLVDSSARLFSMYNTKTKAHDEKMTEGWKGDADGIILFVRENKLFLPQHPLRCHHRLVCSQRPLHHSLEARSRTSS